MTYPVSAAHPRDVIVRDEGLCRLSRLDLGFAQPRVWSVEVPPGRDLQLIGSNRVLIGTERGFQEHDLATGAKVAEEMGYPGTLAARRFPDGITVLSGTEWQGNKGITLVELEHSGKIRRHINYPDHPYVRLVRRTATGNYLFTSNRTILEGDREGRIQWQATLHTQLAEPHAWKALRLPSGDTLIAGGYAGSMQIIRSDGSLARSFSAGSAENPFFFCDYQVLPNGHVVVVNWQGHGTDHGAKGRQLLEFNKQGELVWHWQQDASLVSSLQALLVLDGLDTGRLHCEGPEGWLMPV